MKRVLAIAAVALGLSLTLAAPATAAEVSTSTQYGVGTQTLAAPTSGGRYVYVATNGSDTFRTAGSTLDRNRYPCLGESAAIGPNCPDPSAKNPLRTVQAAIRAARPGDVIVVREGTYTEAIGWGARAGTEASPIVLQAAPGERVVLSGTAIWKQLDWWTIQGLRFTYNAAIQKSGQSIVMFEGGENWSFLNNEVSGSRGVANVLVRAADTGSAAAAVNDYLIAGNCIHDNRGTDAHGTDHNIYLMPGIASRGGVIERNLIFGAPNGTNIKAAAPTPDVADFSPRNVAIRYNTMVSAATGIVIGLKAERIETTRNIIAQQAGGQKWDAGLKGWLLAQPGRNSMKDSWLVGYAQPTRDVAGMFITRNDTTSVFQYTGSLANCTAVPATNLYGHRAP